jgi:nitroreductase
MDVQEAIRDRRSVRVYSSDIVETPKVMALLRAASYAPSAVNSQPWTFAIVQDKSQLKRYSDRAKELISASADSHSLPPELKVMLTDPEFNIFYNAGTLIVICAKPNGQHPDWDCCLAAQNLVLAAHGMGLGTCPIGFAWSLLQQPDVKMELRMAPEVTAVLPIIVGYPLRPTPAVPRNDPEILCWQPPSSQPDFPCGTGSLPRNEP